MNPASHFAKFRKRKWDSETEFALPTLFKPKFIHYAIAVVTLASFVGLGAFSLYSATPHEVEKLAILNESNDAASLAYSQRESFATLLQLERWAADQVTARDVSIERALLGQRLNVLVQGDVTTYSLMSPSYQAALAALDPVIMNLPDGTQEQREKYLLPYRAILSNFDYQVRQMSRQIQITSLDQVQRAVKSRAHSELLQSIALVFSFCSLLLLLILIVREVGRGYQSQRKAIRDERRRLDIAMQNLEISQALDEMQSFLFSKPVEKWSEGEFEAWIHYSANSIAPLPIIVKLTNGPEGRINVEAANPGDNFALQATLITSRMQEMMDMHHFRLRMYNETLFRSQHDPLTGLLNENGMQKELKRIAAENPNDLLAGIFIDIDRFQRINDALGYSFGDDILRQVGDKLRRNSHPGEILVRLNSDEFIVLSPAHSELTARNRALQLQADLSFTVSMRDVETELTFSVGLVVLQGAHLANRDLLHDGDIAKTLAGRQIRAGFGMFTEDASGDISNALTDEYALRQAVKHGEFAMFLQPVISLSNDAIVGAEALVRWQRPGHEIVYPDEFIPKIRRFNLEAEFNQWVMTTVIRMRASAYVFQSQYELDTFRIGLNIEPNQLLESDLSDRIILELERANVKPSDLALEVTEHSLAEGELPMRHLQRMRDLGCSISLDDFGTGYSSLSQAQKLPLTSMKIDKAFLLHAGENSVERQLIKDLKSMAETLDLLTIAEGVENIQVENFLREIGIDMVQGYLYAPALPEIDFWNWVRDYIKGQKAIPNESMEV